MDEGLWDACKAVFWADLVDSAESDEDADEAREQAMLPWLRTPAVDGDNNVNGDGSAHCCNGGNNGNKQRRHSAASWPAGPAGFVTAAEARPAELQAAMDDGDAAPGIINHAREREWTTPGCTWSSA